MSYSVRFEGVALVQLNGLPAAAFDAIVERVTDLVKEPWDAVVMPPGDDPAYRITVFGSGHGSQGRSPVLQCGHGGRTGCRACCVHMLRGLRVRARCPG